MDTWALAGAIKYGPKNANMTKNSKFMLTELWADIASHYNPYLGNMVGPVGLPFIANSSLYLTTKFDIVRPGLHTGYCL